MKYIHTILILFTLISCIGQDKSKENFSIETKNKTDGYSFDTILKCADLSFEDGYFITTDYGCIYNPMENNKFGNILIYFIPKKTISFNQEEVIYKINELSVEETKDEFDIYIYLIEKKYLNYNKLGDPVYYQKDFFVEKLFTNKDNRWELLDSIKVKSINDNDIEQSWRENFINSKIKSLNNKLSKTINNVSEKWHGNYSVWLEYGEIAGQKTGYEIILEITKDSIKATGDGFQMGFVDLLTIKEDNNKLILYHLKNLYGYKQGANMNPEFILIEDKEKYYLTTQWINSDIITKPKKLGYEINKIQ